MTHHRWVEHHGRAGRDLPATPMSAKIMRHIRTLHAQGCSLAEIHLITGVDASIIKDILSTPTDTATPPAPDRPEPEPMGALFD